RRSAPAAAPGGRADADGPSRFGAADTLCGDKRVLSGVNVHAWSKEHVVANFHARWIEDHAVEVGIEASTHVDVRSVIAEERRFDPRTLAHPAQEPRPGLRPPRHLRPAALVWLARH